MFAVKMTTPELTKAVTETGKTVSAALAKLNANLETANELKAREVTVLEDLLSLLRRQCRPRKPANLSVTFLEEKESMAKGPDILTYQVVADAPTDPDVESRKLKVEVNGVVTAESTHGSNTTEFGNIEVPQGASVKLSLVDVDDANNESPALVNEFVAADTNAPAGPQGLGATFVSEREGEELPPAEEPAPTDPPAEEPPAETPPTSEEPTPTEPVAPTDPPAETGSV